MRYGRHMNAPSPIIAQPHPALAVLKDRLHAQGRLRVWSIIITLFGDAIAPRSGVVALADILTITARMGIEGGAVRTAMSRLAKEGWVERRKDGRTSHYALTAHGAETFLAATRRIYAPTFTAEVQIAHLIVTEGETLGLPLRLGVGLLLDQTVPAGALSAKIDLTTAPNWVQRALLPNDLADDYQTLTDDLLRAHGLVHGAEPLDALAIRILSIHFWRRLILRHPAPPAPLTPTDWPGIQCHAALSELYADVLPQSEAWWSKPTTCQAALAKRLNVLQNKIDV